MAFLMVLTGSRRIFLGFNLNARMDSFLLGHGLAFAAFAGVARVMLCDNLKSARDRGVSLIESAKHNGHDP